jgi:peptide subunit release factor 1 (eRF1)
LTTTALPLSPGAGTVPGVLARLGAIPPGAGDVVSCYLKLEPRDKSRGKYLIKMKNRVKETVAGLARKPLERAEREGVAADLERLLRYLEEPGRLPQTRGVALFACGRLGLFEVVPLPQVHRSRLVVGDGPATRELVALEQEFGTILVVACDRTGARCFEVTAFGIAELPSVISPASRTEKFHGERQMMRGAVPGSAGEHGHHGRIREEKHRHYARVAEGIFRINAQQPLSGLVVAGIGVDAAALVPHLHTYLHDLLLGVVRLNPKKATPAEVREAALALREERERAWERAHAEAVRDGLGTGWAVKGFEPTLKALTRGQVRTLLADGHDDDPRIDEAVEDALAQRAQVDVLYDERARREVDGLAALLRFRRG